MLLTAALAGAAIALRADAPALTPEEASRLEPAAIGDALLAPGHDQVVEAVVGPEGMEPPIPPGPTVVTRIKLFFRPRHSTGYPDFCEQREVWLQLRPAARSGDAIVPAMPDRIELQRAKFRWVGRGGGSCDAPRRAFFAVQYDETAGLAAVRRLAGLRQLARLPGVLPFELTIDDQEGRAEIQLAREHPDLVPSPPREMTDARAALATLPLDDITASQRANDWADGLAPVDVAAIKVGTRHGWSVTLQPDWVVALVSDGGRLTAVRIVRRPPPPF